MTGTHPTMEREISPRAEGLQAFIDQAVEQLRRSGGRGNTVPDGLLFFGSWNDTVPRLLIRDPILKPIETRLWSVMRTLVEPAGPATMPDYDTLVAYCNVGSRTTVSHALLILRITRWISLCARVRDPAAVMPETSMPFMTSPPRWVTPCTSTPAMWPFSGR